MIDVFFFPSWQRIEQKVKKTTEMKFLFAMCKLKVQISNYVQISNHVQLFLRFENLHIVWNLHMQILRQCATFWMQFYSCILHFAHCLKICMCKCNVQSAHAIWPPEMALCIMCNMQMQIFNFMTEFATYTTALCCTSKYLYKKNNFPFLKKTFVALCKKKKFHKF